MLNGNDRFQWFQSLKIHKIIKSAFLIKKEAWARFQQKLNKLMKLFKRLPEFQAGLYLNRLYKQFWSQNNTWDSGVKKLI